MGREGRGGEGTKSECKRKAVARHWPHGTSTAECLVIIILLYMYTNNHCHTIWYEAIRKGTHITGFNEHTPQGTLREGKKH